MQIIINGKAHEIATNYSVNGLLEQLLVDVKQVAIELNGEILPRSSFANTQLHDGDKIELVEFVGGG
jgi:sulfur carrier protein